jgi:hypothetical protein
MARIAMLRRSAELGVDIAPAGVIAALALTSASAAAQRFAPVRRRPI